MNRLTLNINGKEIEFSFGLGFLGELLNQLDLDIEEAVEKMNKNPFMMIPKFMYHSASYLKKRRGEELEFDEFEFTDWLDEVGGMSNPSVVIFLNKFTESLTKDVPKEKGKAGGTKKK